MIMDTKTVSKRHQNSRTMVKWPVSVIDCRNHIEAQTENISADGVLLTCQESPPLEGDFEMIIKAPDRYPMKVTAKLVWTEFLPDDDGNTRFGADVQFVSISEKDRQFLHDVISKHYKEKASRLAGAATSAAKTIGGDSNASQGGSQISGTTSVGCDSVAVTLRTRIHMTDVARALATSLEVLKQLNPKIASYYLPTGSYTFNVPPGVGFKVPSALTVLSRNVSRRSEEKKSAGCYVVKTGDTLRDIARKTGISVLNLARFNGMHGSSLKVGQRLRLGRGGR
jgi:LysM repeat protein